jgi:hypothetical protein
MNYDRADALRYVLEGTSTRPSNSSTNNYVITKGRIGGKTLLTTKWLEDAVMLEAQKEFNEWCKKTQGKWIVKPYKKVIYNPPATVVIWNDDTKTIVKTTDGEKFDPERGFLQAYYEKHNGITKTQGNKILHELREQYEKGLEK